MSIPPPSRPPVRALMPADVPASPSSPIVAPRARSPGETVAAAPAGGAGGIDAKSAARARIALIKERIAALRQMLLMFGGKVSASVLQELRQLAGELKAAAAVLAAGSGDAAVAAPASTSAPGASGGDATGAPSYEGLDAEHVDAARAAYAEQAQADDTAGTAPPPSGPTSARTERLPERDADERLAASAWQALRSAQATAKQLKERRRAGLPTD